MTTTKLPRITPSNVNDLECAKKFYNLHILNNRQPWKINQATQFGIGVHAILKNVYDPKNGIPPNLEDLDAYTKEAFYAFVYPDNAIRENDIQRSCRLVCGYVGNDDEEDALGTVAVERFANFTIRHEDVPKFEISAKLDRIIIRESNPTELVVRDYKTAQPKPNIKEAFIQLWVAKLLFTNYESYKLETDWIDEDGRIERSTILAKDLKGIKRLKSFKTLTSLPRTDYLPEPGDTCTYCPLRIECQPSQEASLESLDDFFDSE